jgi:hypothetical protein
MSASSSSLPPAAAAVDLNWQSFPSMASSSSAAPPPALLPPLLPPSSSSSSAVAPSLPDPPSAPSSSSPSSSSSSSSSPAAAATTLLSYLTPSFYQSLFDVDTADVLTRLRAALLPSPSSSPSAFANACNGRPDWYGPVWVSLSLIFVIASGSQLAGWLAHLGDAEVGSATGAAAGASASPLRYDIGELSSAIFVVYAFAFWSPMVLRAMMAYLGLGRGGLANAGAGEVAPQTPSSSSSSSGAAVLLPGSVPGLVCIWGYSLAPYVPAAVRFEFGEGG